MKRWIVSAAVVGLLSAALSIPVAAPLVAPTTAECEITQAKSLEATTPSRIEFVNASGTTVNVLWLDYQGNRVLYRTLLPSESYVQQTFVTHPWVAVDTMGVCRGYVLSDRPEKTFRIAPRPTFTAVVCRISVVAPSSSTCTAQVADASPQRSNPPTGAVTFTATSGTIGQDCTLQGTPGSPGIASCTVPYLPSTSLVQGEPPPVLARYGGDAFFNPSSGGTSYLQSSIFLPSAIRVSLNAGNTGQPRQSESVSGQRGRPAHRAGDKPDDARRSTVSHGGAEEGRSPCAQAQAAQLHPHDAEPQSHRRSLLAQRELSAQRSRSRPRPRASPSGHVHAWFASQ